jgi:hypothetical protein
VILLPKNYGEFANGGLYEQRVRCGKRNCRCSEQNGDRHLAYYFFTRLGGKQKKIYVRKADIEVVSLVIKAARSRKKWRAGLFAKSYQHWQVVRDTVRKHETQTNVGKKQDK